MKSGLGVRMHPALVARLLILLAVANGTPLAAKAILGRRLDRPLDGGAMFLDGRPWFGPSKTIRGITVALIATVLAAPLLGFQWQLGALAGASAIAGDLFSSFVKRRLGLASSSMAIGLDQIPESLFPLLAARIALPIGWLDILAGVAIFFVGEILLSRILFGLKLRETPY